MMPSVLATMSRFSAFEINSKLSPKAPMPRLLAAYANYQSDNALIDMVEEPLEVDLDELGILPPMQFGSASDGGYGAHFCMPGDGYHAFKAFACNGSAPANAWVWCDPSVAHYWRKRWTNGHKRWHSFGLTTTCGAPGETRHSYKKSNGK